MSTTATIFSAARYDLQDFGGQKYDDTQLLEYLNRALRILDEVLIQQNSDYTTATTPVYLVKAASTASLPTGCDNIKELWWQGNTRLIKESLDRVWQRYQMYLRTETYDATSDWTASGNEYYTSQTYPSVSAEESIAGADYVALTHNDGNGGGSLSAGEWDYVDSSDRLYVRLTGDVAAGATNPVRTEYIAGGQPEYYALNDTTIQFDKNADKDYVLHAFFHQRATALTDGATIPYSGDFDDLLREGVVMLAGKAKDEKLVRPDEMLRRTYEKYMRRRVISREYGAKHYRLDF